MYTYGVCIITSFVFFVCKDHWRKRFMALFFILISGPPITLLVVFPFNQNYLKDLSATCRALWFVDNIIKISIGIFILFSLLS